MSLAERNIEPRRGKPIVVIIGGGIAGSVAACALAGEGARVVLFEPRASGAPRRAKCCGHCLSARSRAPLAAFGLDGLVRAHATGELTRAEIVVGGACVAVPSRGLAVRRDTLDPALLDEARARGVEVRGCAARIEGTDGLVIADDGTRLPADLVVGADGLASRVARAAGLVDASEQGRRYGVSFDVEAALPVDDGVVRMSFIDGGYLGLVRQGRIVHAGMLFDAGTGAAEALARFAAEDPVLARPELVAALAQAAGAGPIPFRTLAAARGRVVLVGDAAGYVEPLSGEGMTWAVESAAALVDAVRECGVGRAAARAYLVHRERRLRPTVVRARMLAALAARPRVARGVVRAAAFAPRPLREALGELVA